MSYLQSSDIRQLFPRKLALHMRERKKKKKYQRAWGQVGRRLRKLETGAKIRKNKAWRPRMAKN